jgi:hypothetical protein
MIIHTQTHTHTHTHTHTYIYSENENKIALVSLSDGTMGGGRGKENVREWKILKTAHLYINII